LPITLRKFVAGTNEDIKKIVRLIVPPLFVDLYRRLTPNWEGIYTNFREVPTEGEGLDGDIWAEIVERETSEVAKEITKGGTIPALLSGYDSLLPLLVSVVAHKNNKIRILDFGGVVDSDKNCQRGRLIHGNDPQIIFHQSLPERISAFDIVHMDSVLQYIEDYPLLLKTLCGYKPEYFLFVRLSAGNIPTYVAKQMNVPGISCPYRFINIDDLIRVMNECGYALAFKSAGDREHKQGNFPVEYRVGRACNLLFIRGDNVEPRNPSQ
jgi:hypothetical protein